MSDVEPIYDESGEPLGIMAEGEDGDRLLIGFDGQVLAGVDADNDPISLDEYPAYVELEPDEDGIEDRLAALEAYAEQPVQFEQVLEPLGEALTTEDLQAQADNVERQLDRPLTLRERRLYGGRALDHVLHGDARPDLENAMLEMHAEGHEILNVDDEHRGRAHEARTAFISERLHDAERQAAHQEGYDDLGEVEPPSQGVYDLDDRSERQAYIADRLRGATDADSTYSSTDYQGDYE